jgi:hypothetical protein
LTRLGARALALSALELSALGLALLMLVAACVRLPQIGDDECGNGVIEPPEDCDTFGVDGGALCRPQGSVGECHLDCSATGAGRDACPAGWGCDLGGICRRPTGEFDPAREFEVGTAALLASADFDGDGRADVLSSEPLDAFGVTRIKFHYFDEEGELSDTRPFPRLLLSPAIARMNDDARADVVFTDERVGMLLGRTDRSWVPETFSSYRFPNTAIRTLTVRDGLIEDTGGFLVFTLFENTAGVYVPDPANDGLPRRLGTLPVPVERFVREPVAAQVVEGAPCKQSLLAFEGEARFTMFDVCQPGSDGSVVWRPEMTVAQIALDPPEPIVNGLLAADVNGDGHLDVIAGAAARSFVAYGDGQTLATAVPWTITPAEGAAIGDVPMPLAVGEVTGDGVADFVFPTGILLSQPSSLGQSLYSPGSAGQQRWTAAVIADLNANGDPDILVGSSDRPGLSFFNGTGTPDFTFFALPTSRPVEQLVVGDFDGDFIEDVAFTQDSGSGQDERAVMMAFGAPFGAPLPPVAVARLPNVEQMMAYREAKLSHLLISSSEDVSEGRRGVLTLLTGSTDRLPVALYELTTFAADSSVNGSLGVRVLGGAFTSGAPGDVLAIGSQGAPMDAALQFWLLPALASTPGTPVLLSGSLPPDVHPTVGAGGLSLSGVAADLDGDGRDEALFAMPGQDAAQCALLVFAVEPERVTLRSDVRVAEPCVRAEVAAVHADGDGRLDVAWLSGRADGSERALSILWNDGNGGLSADARSLVADRFVSPQAFALLPDFGARGTQVVYATPTGLVRAPITAARAVGEHQPLLPLEGCTGLTAADVDGDGALDLVAAARGNLHVLRAGLVL